MYTLLADISLYNPSLSYTAGERSLSGLLSSCSSGQLALQGQPPPGQGLGQLQGPSVEQGPGQLPGQSQGQSALEGFQRLDSTAQIALLQRLTAAKAEGAEGKWLQASISYSSISAQHVSLLLFTIPTR